VGHSSPPFMLPGDETVHRPAEGLRGLIPISLIPISAPGQTDSMVINRT